MTNQGSNGAADGHQQSIGEEDGQVVDGIKGSHPGTQEPSGAHVDAGDPGPAAGQQPEPVTTNRDRGVRTASGAPVRGMSGMSAKGIPQPGNTTGALGSHARKRIKQMGHFKDAMFAGNWTGSLTRGGQTIAVIASASGA
jgi:hypothetical protein